MVKYLNRAELYALKDIMRRQAVAQKRLAAVEAELVSISKACGLVMGFPYSIDWDTGEVTQPDSEIPPLESIDPSNADESAWEAGP